MGNVVQANAGWVMNDAYAKRINRSAFFFWAAFVTYALVYAVTFAFSITSIPCQIIQIGCLVVMALAAIDLIKWKLESAYLQVLFFLYFLWMLFAIHKGIGSNFQLMKYEMTSADFGFGLYFVPLVILFPKNLAFYKKLFDATAVMCLVFGLCALIFYKSLINPDRGDLVSQSVIESISKNLGFTVGFLLLTFGYHIRKRRLLALGTFVLILLLCIYRARRGLILLYVATGLFSYLLYLFTTKKKVIIVFFSIIVGFFLVVFVAQAVTNKENKLFGFLTERGSEDTRTPVETYFYDDMSQKDWLKGRGINGTYFCPIVDDGDINGEREVIETGYLQIVLNSGLISLILLLLIAVPAMIKGLFFSKNILSRAAGIWILIFILSLYPANPATFTLSYIIVWLSIGICYSKEIRNIPETTLRQYFRPDEIVIETI